MRVIKNKLWVLNQHAAFHFNCTVLRVDSILMRVKSRRKVFLFQSTRKSVQLSVLQILYGKKFHRLLNQIQILCTLCSG
jgi:hypothetical protein